METFLNTGAPGTLGRAVVHQALDRGHHVRAYTRQSHTAVPEGIAVYQGDSREGSGLAEAASPCHSRLGSQSA